MPPREPNENRPVPVDETPQDISDFLESIYGVDLNYELALSGKTKTVELPGDRELILSPGGTATFTNLDDPSDAVTVNITGSFHKTSNDDGTIDLVSTGRSLLLD